MTVNGLFEVGRCRIERDLDRISCGTKVATIRPQVMDVLVYLTEHAGQIISSEELLDRLWPGKVVTSASVYNCITELRSAFLSLDSEQTYIETVPKRGYRLVAPVVGVDTTSAPDDQDRSRARFTMIALSAFAALVLGASLVAIYVTQYRPGMSSIETGSEEKSIVVIPFADLSPEPGNDYLVDGISEELINVLARVPDLEVTARTSSFFFKGRHAPVAEIAATLNVNYIVEGAVRRDSDRLRVTYQLVHAENGVQIWADALDRTVQDIFDVQAEIAGSVARSLSVVIDDDEREAILGLGTQSVEAYEHYLRGMSVYHDWSVSDASGHVLALRAREWFDKSIEADPEFAAAYTMRAELYIRTLDEEIPQNVILSSPRDSRNSEQVREYLLSDLANAIEHARDPGVRLVNQFQIALFSNDIHSLSRLIGHMDPEALVNSPVLYDIARLTRVHLLLQQPDWVLAVSEGLNRVDPLDAAGYNFAWDAAIVGGQVEAARGHLDRGIAAVGDVIWFRHQLFMTQVVERDIDELLRKVDGPGWERTGYGGTMRAFVLAIAERYDDALEAISALTATGRQDIFLALALLHSGDEEAARKMLGEIDAHPGGAMHFIHTYIEFGGRIPFDIRWTPNFAAALDELGLQVDEAGFVQKHMESIR